MPTPKLLKEGSSGSGGTQEDDWLLRFQAQRNLRRSSRPLYSACNDDVAGQHVDHVASLTETGEDRHIYVRPCPGHAGKDAQGDATSYLLRSGARGRHYPSRATACQDNPAPFGK